MKNQKELLYRVYWNKHAVVSASVAENRYLSVCQCLLELNITKITLAQHFQESS